MLLDTPQKNSAMQSYFAAFYHASWGALEAKIMKNVRKLAEVYGETDLRDITPGFGSVSENKSREQYERIKRYYYTYASQKKWKWREEFIRKVSLASHPDTEYPVIHAEQNVNWLTGKGVPEYVKTINEITDEHESTESAGVGAFVSTKLENIANKLKTCTDQWTRIELENFDIMLGHFDMNPHKFFYLKPLVVVYAREMGV